MFDDKNVTIGPTPLCAAPALCLLKMVQKPKYTKRHLEVQMNFFSDLPCHQKNEIVVGTTPNTNALYACVYLNDNTGAQQKALVEECVYLQALQIAGRLDLCGLPIPPHPKAVKLLHLGDSARPLRPLKAHRLRRLHVWSYDLILKNVYPRFAFCGHKSIFQRRPA